MSGEPRRSSSCTGCLLGAVLVCLVVVFSPAILISLAHALTALAVFLERLL